MAFILFGFVSIFSYVFVKFVVGWDLKCVFSYTPMYVSSLVRFLCVLIRFIRCIL